VDRCKSRKNLAKTHPISFVFSIIPNSARPTVLDRRTGLYSLSRRLLIRLQSTFLLHTIGNAL
jgi:hypothetical protein